MSACVHPQSALGRIIALVPDPRSRQGRIYPLAAILGMLLLGALEGEGSLLGMWARGKKHWRVLVDRLGEIGPPEPPELSTVWYVMQRIDARCLEQALGAWVESEEILSVDGKRLRGSQRGEKRALQVLAVAGQKGGQVLAQCLVEGDEGVTAVALLSEIPLEGKVVSLDAGLMERGVVKAISKKGGITSGF